MAIRYSHAFASPSSQRLVATSLVLLLDAFFINKAGGPWLSPGSPWPSLGAPGLPGAPSNYLNKRPAPKYPISSFLKKAAIPREESPPNGSYCPSLVPPGPSWLPWVQFFVVFFYFRQAA